MTTTPTTTDRPTLPDGVRWASDGSGYVELALLLEDAECGYHQGQCDDDIAGLRTVPYIAAQLAAINPELAAKSLREWGAWSAEELANHDDNLDRILWLACGDIVEAEWSNPTTPEE
jgi:hypothetical protein